MQEIWKPIPGYDDRYEVSNLGRVRAKPIIICVLNRWGCMVKRHVKGGVLKPYKNKSRGGYNYVNLHDSNGQYMRRVARLVLEAFIGNCPQKHEACHSDGIADNDKLENLRWGTKKANAEDKRLHGTIPIGDKHPSSKLTDKEVNLIRQSDKSRYELAAIFGVHHGHIYNIRAGFKRALA